jgi:hypothetical protein
MAATETLTINPDNIASATAIAIQPLFGVKLNDVASLLGFEIGTFKEAGKKYEMSVQVDENALDIAYANKSGENVLRIKTELNEGKDAPDNHRRIQIDCVRPEDKRGFRLTYTNFEGGTTDNFALSMVQIVPEKGFYTSEDGQLTGKKFEEAPRSTDAFPQNGGMFSVDILPNGNFKYPLHENVFTIFKKDDHSAITLNTTPGGESVIGPFSLKVPSNIGISLDTIYASLTKMPQRMASNGMLSK